MLGPDYQINFISLLIHIILLKYFQWILTSTSTPK